MLSPAAVIQRQLDAYNARDLDAWLATYAEHASQFEYPDKLLAQGHAALRERMQQRFADPALHARLVQRAVMGTMVIDQELVTRSVEGGVGHMELLAIYQVHGSRIQTASFVFGPIQEGAPS